MCRARKVSSTNDFSQWRRASAAVFVSLFGKCLLMVFTGCILMAPSLVSRVPVSDLNYFYASLYSPAPHRAGLTASVAQLAELRFCKPGVVGSSPSASFQRTSAQTPLSQEFTLWQKTGSGFHRGEFQSGQMGQTVNLVAQPSQVRILLPPLGETENTKPTGKIGQEKQAIHQKGQS